MQDGDYDHCVTAILASLLLILSLKRFEERYGGKV